MHLLVLEEHDARHEVVRVSLERVRLGVFERLQGVDLLARQLPQCEERLVVDHLVGRRPGCFLSPLDELWCRQAVEVHIAANLLDHKYNGAVRRCEGRLKRLAGVKEWGLTKVELCAQHA